MTEATVIIHWPSGALYCCERHAEKALQVGAALGMLLATTRPAPQGVRCKNCENEAKERAKL